jgi:hypothetical protein
MSGERESINRTTDVVIQFEQSWPKPPMSFARSGLRVWRAFIFSLGFLASSLAVFMINLHGCRAFRESSAGLAVATLKVPAGPRPHAGESCRTRRRSYLLDTRKVI